MVRLLAAAVLALLLAAAAAQQFYPFSAAVGRYARLDLDVRAMEVAADKSQWRAVDAIYRGGRGATPRTLRKLSLQAPSVMKNDPLYKRYRAYWNNPRYADKLILDGILARGAVKTKRPVFRAEIPVKGAQYHTVWMWVIHKMESSVRACAAGRAPVALQQLDQAVADYRGSIVLRNLKNSGYMLHTLAEKRCIDFGTCARGARGPAKVNVAIYAQLRAMKNFLRADNCARARFAKNRVIALMHVPLVQGCLRYMVKVEQARAKKDWKDVQKSHAEGWMFCSAVLPSIARCSRGVANAVLNNFKPSAKNPMSTKSGPLSRRLRSTYGCLRINCGLVGKLVESGKTLIDCK